MAFPAAKRSPRFTYLLRSAEAQSAHSGGVNALCVSADGQQLYTGSRDGSVRCWSLSREDAPGGTAPPCTACYEGHTDWVTSLALLTDGEGVLASASCDATVRLWRAAAAGSFSQAQPPAVELAALRGHSDYVTCCASAAGASAFASAGLGGEAFLWDATAGVAVAALRRSAPPQPHQPRMPTRIGGADAPGSIYALAMAAGSSPGAPALLTGDATGDVRLWDTRCSPAAHALLSGHTDTVRALLFDATGRRCVSAGADGSVRLWDARTLRQLARVACHAGSVWAVAADERFTTLWSGGRDGCLWATKLGAGYEDDGAPAGASHAPALALARSTLLARANAPVTALALEPGGGGGGGGATAAQAREAGVWVSTTDAAVQLWPRAAPAAPAAAPRFSAPLGAVAGAPGGGLRRAELLPDRRTVLTQDADGAAALWDLPGGCVARQLGSRPPGDWEAARALALPYAPPAALPAWAAVDARLGCLAVHLEPGSCFTAEAYASELAVPGASSDARLNLGHQALTCVLGPWARWAAEEAQAQQPTASAFHWPCPVPLLQFQGPDGATHRAQADRLQACDRLLLPGWVTEAVLYGPPSSSEAPKTCFLLQPAPGPHALPPLQQAKLTAPRILRASKVCSYIVAKLELAPDEEEELIELTCDGKPFSADMSLSAASAYLWRQPGDLVIHYARKRGAQGEPEGGEQQSGKRCGGGDVDAEVLELRSRLTGL